MLDSVRRMRSSGWCVLLRRLQCRWERHSSSFSAKQSLSAKKSYMKCEHTHEMEGSLLVVGGNSFGLVVWTKPHSGEAGPAQGTASCLLLGSTRYSFLGWGLELASRLRTLSLPWKSFSFQNGDQALGKWDSVASRRLSLQRRNNLNLEQNGWPSD